MGRGVAKVVQAKFDARTLHERPEVAAEARMVDDGSGQKEVRTTESPPIHFLIHKQGCGEGGRKHRWFWGPKGL